MTRWALCFSGGGFRATLFHLGVLRRLCETGEINNVRVITGVSGGSILAAHLALNWDAYRNGGDDFEVAASELVDFAQRDVRGRIVRRWLLSRLLLLGFGLKAFNRISLLETEYARLYKKSDLGILGPTAECSSRPEFYLLATSMTTGDVCAFSSLGFERGNDLFLARTLPLAWAVSSSSAFPPLFPPFVLTRDMLDATSKQMPQRFECLSDGGIYDNLGMRWLLTKKSQEFDRAILCDASAPLHWNVESKFGSILTRTIRSTDILMRRVVDLDGCTKACINEGHMPQIELMSITMSCTGAQALHAQLEAGIPLIRSDLNKFVDEEVELLQQHGAAVAEQVLGLVDGNTGLQSARMFMSDSEHARLRHLLSVLRRARRNPLGLWNSRDWAAYIVWGVMLSPILGVCIALAFQAARVGSLTTQLTSTMRESDRRQTRIAQQEKVISELKEAIAPDASAIDGPNVGHIIVSTGVHVHFVPSTQGAMKVDLANADSCLPSRQCGIAEPGDPKWGTLFVSYVPGTYTLVISNGSNAEMRVRVTPHINTDSELKPSRRTITLKPWQTVEYEVKVNK